MIYKLHMSHSFYKYECPDCGYTIDGLSEGGRLFLDVFCELLQCTQCRDVKSVNLAPGQEREDNFPLSECCHVKMRRWDGRCPQCGTKMDKVILYDDF